MMRRLPLCLCAVVMLVSGCTKDDLGQRCYPPADPNLPTQPISGESPVLEVVAMQRSSDCDTFQCLSDRGYLPYCTRSCTHGKVGGACTTNAQCTGKQHCFQGTCRDDDCPGGFQCTTVQDVGPLEGQLFCVYLESCTDNRSCGNLGEMDCVSLSCYDQTLLTVPVDPTEAHLLTCKPESSATCVCQCPGGAATCADSALICTGANGSAWPADSVQRRTVCMRHGVAQ
jgi:hypothetical protein